MKNELKKMLWSLSFVLIAVACILFIPREVVGADTGYSATFDFNVARIDKYISKDSNYKEIKSSLQNYSVMVSEGGFAHELDEKKPDIDIYKYYSYAWSVNGQVVDLNTYSINANTKFVAVWTPVTYYISYSYPMEIVDEIDNIELGITYTVESPRIDYYKPQREHYIFVDWHSSNKFTLDNVELYRPAGSIGNKTIYPEWTPIEYSIDYHTDAENIDNPTTYDVEADNYVLCDPKKEGHIFEGWYLDPEYKKSCTQIICSEGGDIDLYPKWDLVTYDVIYVLPDGKTETIETEYGKKANLPSIEKSFFEIIKTSEPIDNVTSDMVVYISLVNIWYVYAIGLALILGVIIAILIVIKRKRDMHNRLRHIYQSNLTRIAKRK